VSEKIDGDEGANKQADPEVKTEEVSQPDSQLDSENPTNSEIEAELLENEDAAPSSDLQEQLNAANDQLLRSQAEIQNIRRRAERDVENAHKFGLEKFANQLLPVVDNLQRALDAIDTNDESQKAIYEGIDLTLKSFLDVLAQFKIEAIDPSGEPFDADYHQAVSMVPNPDVEPNTVLEVFQKGYKLNGRLMRPAMVVVSTST
jgi:molecular chaperone GrpE